MGLYVDVLNTAIEEAVKSTHHPRIGAVVFKGKRIFGSGHNGIRSSNIPMKHRNWVESLHAEQAALLDLDWNKLKGCSMLVVRVSKTGVFGICKPCPMCSKIINHVGIKTVYYTNEQGEIVSVKANNLIQD